MNAGEKYQVTVESILPIGVVVRMPDNSTELIHISQIASCFVDSVENFVSVGEVYEAEVVEGQGKKPIQLSLKHLGLKNKNYSYTHCKFNQNKPRSNTQNKPRSNTQTRYNKPVVKHPSQVDYAKFAHEEKADLETMIQRAQKDLDDKTRSRKTTENRRKRRRDQ